MTPLVFVGWCLAAACALVTVGFGVVVIAAIVDAARKMFRGETK